MRRALRLGGLIALSNPGNLISSEAGKIEEKRKQDWPASLWPLPALFTAYYIVELSAINMMVFLYCLELVGEVRDESKSYHTI